MYLTLILKSVFFSDFYPFQWRMFLAYFLISRSTAARDKLFFASPEKEFKSFAFLSSQLSSVFQNKDLKFVESQQHVANLCANIVAN